MKGEVTKPVSIALIVAAVVLAALLAWWFFGRGSGSSTQVDSSVYPKAQEGQPGVEQFGAPPPGQQQQPSVQIPMPGK
jgi:hypothetical protein